MVLSVGPSPFCGRASAWAISSTRFFSLASRVHKLTVSRGLGGAELQDGLRNIESAKSVAPNPEIAAEGGRHFKNSHILDSKLARLRKRAHYEAHGGHVCYGTEELVR